MPDFFTIRCPHCSLRARHRALRTVTNLLLLVLNVACLAVQFFAGDLFFAGFELRRRCLRCGTSFGGGRRQPPDFERCIRCDYNLTGNESGRCPECGWKLTRRFRAFHKLHPARRLRNGHEVHLHDRHPSGSPPDV